MRATARRREEVRSRRENSRLPRDPGESASLTRSPASLPSSHPLEPPTSLAPSSSSTAARSRPPERHPHESLGFRSAGIFPSVGYKLGIGEMLADGSFA